VRNGTVVVDGDRIHWVGPRAAAPPGSDDELGDAVLMPGLVNTHIHLDLAAFAGALSGEGFFPWIRTLVRGLAEASDDAALADASLWSVADQLTHGVTTMAHTGPGRAPFDAMRSGGARGVAYLEVFGPDPRQAADAIANLRERVTTARRDETALVRIGVSPHAPYSVSDALYAATATYARAEHLPVAVHIAESEDESRLVAGAGGEFAAFLRQRDIDVNPRADSPVALLERTGVLATRPLCIHAVRVDAADVRRIADAGASVAHCPLANAWFAHGSAPVAALRDAGVAVGLGTDSLASNDDVRLLAEARAAADGALTFAERLHMATQGGADALGIGAHVGMLVPGRQADLAAFAIDDIAECDSDPSRYVIERCADAPALLTVVAGTVRARRGDIPGANHGVAERMATHVARVRDWAGLANARHPILDSKT
jgi:cytosine/adenosine deaminase-related metal-dependent hydrolase